MASLLTKFVRPTPLLFAVALLAVAGCGPSRPATVPVTGTVTLDGKPIAEACVMLLPEAGGRTARGTTGEDGRFTLTTFDPDDGAVPGKHLVSVTKSEMTGVQADAEGLSGPADPGGVREVWIIPKKFSDAKNSGLTVEVVAGMDTLDFALTSN